MTSIPDDSPRAWANVDLRALLANARTIARLSGVRLLPMVKANGYGAGAVPVARALEAAEPWGYGVISTAEAIELRAAGIDRPIVVFSPLQSWQIPVFQSQGLRPVIGDAVALKAWLAATAAPFHVEVDTGMARSGFRWDDDPSWRDLLRGASGFEGIFTHFYSADEEPASVARQWARFAGVVAGIPVRPPLVHAANSAAALRHPDVRGDMVRPGIFLYGGAAGGETAAPVVRLQTRVVALRRVHAGETVGYGAAWTAPEATTIATLAIGYADGVLRSLANRGAVELGGRVVSLRGRVTMDFVMVEATEDTALGDIATIFGGQVSVDDQARRAGTISYELLTAMGRRVTRRYYA